MVHMGHLIMKIHGNMNLINKLLIMKGISYFHLGKHVRSIHTSQILLRIRHPNDSISKSELKCRLKDQLPESYRLVYRAPMDFYAYAAHAVSTGSLIGFGIVSTWKVFATMSLLGLPITNVLNEQLAQFSPLEISTAVGGFLSLNCALWLISTRYVLRIYSDQQIKPRYCCVMIGLLPMRTYKIEFESGELKIASGLARKFPWKDSYFRLGTQSLILLEQHFKTPADLHRMLGSHNDHSLK